jgi:hypothetical protein
VWLPVADEWPSVQSRTVVVVAVAGRPKRRAKLGIAKHSDGVQPDGSWVPQFEGQRPPFARGNELELVHGGRAVVSNLPEATRLAELLREHVPGYSEGDAPLLELYALCLCRVASMERWLAEHEADDPEPYNIDRVRQELRHQTTAARRLADDLGLSPKSRASMMGDLAAARAASDLRGRYG